ncbi:hypothetical protein [Streptomyces ziwulingensis]|uniref:Uncharacterized protein n=1 Tax=Streptomyces ziwulingensis TaxID=1045501 RepID=A0ABP9BTN4_9ACTN
MSIVSGGAAVLSDPGVDVGDHIVAEEPAAFLYSHALPTERAGDSRDTGGGPVPVGSGSRLPRKSAPPPCWSRETGCMNTFVCIRDSAAPLAEGLVGVQDLNLRVSPADVLVSYTYHGCIVRVADRSAAHRDGIEEVFRSVFTAAGWGVEVRDAGGLSMRHPVGMTRMSHDAGS